MLREFLSAIFARARGSKTKYHQESRWGWKSRWLTSAYRLVIKVGKIVSKWRKLPYLPRKSNCYDQFWKLVEKSLDLIFDLPIITPCAPKRAARTFKKEEPRNWQRSNFVQSQIQPWQTVLNRLYLSVQGATSDNAPWGEVDDNNIAWVWVT